MDKKPNANIIMYTTEDGLTKIEVSFDDETVWLSADQMAELFQRDKSTISRHIKNIFSEGELNREAVVANYATTASDGKTYQVVYYNLDVIISVGYRVKSHRGTQFRIWATNILKEYMIQNKMHWAAHKHTAAEVIYERIDSEKKNLGLTSWQGETIRRSDVEVAKNYLSESELDALNKIVTAYLDIAEVHALNHEPMYMKDWLETIDDYLKMTRRDILTTTGHISHKQAIDKAHSEYDKFRRLQYNDCSSVERDFLENLDILESIEDGIGRQRLN